MSVQPTIGGLAQLLYRRRWSMLLIMLVVGGLGAAYLLHATPLYRSDASLIVRFGSTAPTNISRDSTPDVADPNNRRETVQAHATILTSPDLARQAIEAFGLARLYPSIAASPPAVGTPMDAAIARFEHDLFVSPELAGNVIRVAFSHTDPQIARGMLDQLVKSFVERENEIFASASVAFQTSQVEEAAARLDAAQTELSRFKSSHGIADYDTQMNALVKERTDLGSALQTAQVALGEAKAQQVALKSLLATVPATVSSSSGDKYSSADVSQSRVAALRAQEQEMLATHGPDWPALRGLRASIAEASATARTASAGTVSRQIVRPNEVWTQTQIKLLQASVDADGGARAVATLQRQVDAIGKQIADLEALRAGLVERQRETDLADATYRTIVMHLEDSRIGADRLRDNISRVAVIAQPSLPYRPAAPRYLFLSLCTAAAAVLLAVAYAILRHVFDDHLRTPQEVMARLSVPVLATFDKN